MLSLPYTTTASGSAGRNKSWGKLKIRVVHKLCIFRRFFALRPSHDWSSEKMILPGPAHFQETMSRSTRAVAADPVRQNGRPSRWWSQEAVGNVASRSHDSLINLRVCLQRRPWLEMLDGRGHVGRCPRCLFAGVLDCRCALRCADELVRGHKAPLRLAIAR